MLSLALIVNVLSFAYSTQLPQQIDKCQYNDAECIRENINKIIQLYPEGVPELNISSFKEFRPADLELIDTARVGGLWITMRLLNQVIAGMENATVRQVSGFQRDPNKSKIDITVHVPRLTHRSSYAMELRWLTLVQTNTTGACYAEFHDVNLSLNLKVIVRYQQQRRYLTVYQLTPQLQLGRIIWI
ncbi:uncharacterized protein LOC108595380 [Drosophila busckii]|uniref:uncharacterized protein LOC108595380 n=1 Tax=Drosophila busckii TaxID=30019 RepID=UPI00083EC347|nr:uncharacterized protein LOC108595380 [Drosophila busckii]